MAEKNGAMGLTIFVNGSPRQIREGNDRSLLEVLREELRITGPKYGCGEGVCGACTVLVGRRAVTACTMPASAVAGQRITTAEGLAEDGVLHPAQQAWLEEGAMQCGYCTPGWLTATASLLTQVTRSDGDRIAAALAGHVCRCCTYPRILRAVRRAAELAEHPELLTPVPSSPETGTQPPAAPAVPWDSPAVPWDQAAKDADSFFQHLGDGLVTVASAAAGSGKNRAGLFPDAWLHVGGDGSVTGFTGKVEAGQSTRTGLALLVAEELRVEPGKVRVVMGDTSLSPFDPGTFGSCSMPYAAPPLRAAAAAARGLLIRKAAERFRLPAEDLAAANGVVAGPNGAPSIAYGELLTGVRLVEHVPSSQPLTPSASWHEAGRPARTPDGADIVTGRKRFPADLTLDGMLHGCVLRAPAHGSRLRHADTTAAQAMRGVTVVRDGDFIGVVADEPASARRAVEAIDAAWDFSPQPSRADLAEHLRSNLVSGEGQGAPFLHEEGRVAEALAAGPVRLKAAYDTAYIAHVPMEPRCALAAWRDNQLTVWTGTSTPFPARRGLAKAFGIQERDVHVIVPDYGGGFGGKHGNAVALEAARLARAAARAVKVQWSREEEFRCGYLRPAALIDISSSASESGEITGWCFTNINAGAAGILSPYRVPNQRVIYQPAESPLPQGAYRAMAATANHFARESHMDELAHQLGTDPLEFRIRHLADDRLADVFRAAADRIGWKTHSAGTPRGNGTDTGTGTGTGTGIAGGVEKGGRVATAAEVSVDDDGTLHVRRLVTAFDCGTVIHPDGLINQIEGAVMMGLGGALFEAIDFADGRIVNASLTRYRVPRLSDLPRVDVILLDHKSQRPAGGGETPMIAVAPAIANAIYDAKRIRIRSMPLAHDGKVRQPHRS